MSGDLVKQEDPIAIISKESANLPFRLLGPLEVAAAGIRLELGGLRQSKLLAMLLLNRQHPTSTSRVIDVLWDAPPQSARQQVHNSIGGIRRVLSAVPGAEITTSEAGYQLRVPDELIDVQRFESCVDTAQELETQGHLKQATAALRTALAYWRGPALAGLDSPYFQSVATQLDEERLVAIERLLSLRLRLGDASSLVVELLGLIDEYPLRESLRRSLMLALNQLGRQAEALAVYEETRRLVATELGLDPSPKLRELHTQILRGEVADITPESDVAASERTKPQTAIVDSPPRCFLPRHTSEFTGRSTESSQLLSSIHESPSSALVISAIDGMGGLGKTTLAIHLAHQLADEFPDGQLFVDLHGFSVGREPVPPEHALEELLRQAGVPVELIPSDILAREQLWRSQLAGKRALVVLDNVKDEAQVRPLIPGAAETLVLVTSRRKLAALEGSVPLSLDVLPHEDAVELFRQVAGRERVTDDPIIDDVVDLCGRLPLAIRIAAARFRNRKHWPLKDLLTQLRTHKRRTRFLRVGDRNVITVLSLSYQYLTAEEKRMFRLLSLHPGADFDAPAAAALCGIALDESEDHLEALHEHSLLIERSGGRYEFHDLVRDCATELAQQHDSAEQRRAAVHRILDYFLFMAHNLCRPRALEPFRFNATIEHVPDLDLTELSTQDGHKLLEVNHSGLRAACQLAIDQAWHSHAWQLPCALVPYLAYFNYGPDVFELFERSLGAAQAIGDRHGEVASLAAMAVIARDYGSEKMNSVDLYGRAIELSRSAGRDEWRLQLSIDMCIALSDEHRFQETHDVYTEMLDLAIRLGLKRSMVNIANNLGVLSRDMGRLDEALKQFERVRAIDGDEVSHRMRTALAFNRGLVLHLLGKQEEALSELRRALALSEEGEHRATAASTLAVISAVHRSVGDPERALATGRDALIRARSHQRVELECKALSALGETHVSIGNADSAEQAFTEALKLSTSRDLREHMARALEGLAHVRLAGGDLGGARHHWEEAIAAYPLGATTVAAARTHLDALGESNTSCFRCKVSPGT